MEGLHRDNLTDSCRQEGSAPRETGGANKTLEGWLVHNLGFSNIKETDQAGILYASSTAWI